jgi:phage terminase large subunit-like protein
MTPECFYLLQSYDTAFEEGEENDYSARTTWGLFMHPGPDGIERTNMILIERYNERVGFPALRKEAHASYLDYHPDRVLVEKKVSGHSLIQELRRKQVPVKAWSPDKFGKKLARAHAASVVFEQGLVWYMDRRGPRK